MDTKKIDRFNEVIKEITPTNLPKDLEASISPMINFLAAFVVGFEDIFDKPGR